MESQWLHSEWRARRASDPIDAVMRFADAGLVFGVGIVLSPAGASARDISIDVTEPRLSALLAAAHLRSPTPLGLAHIRKAAERWRGGNDDLAAVHLALSGLGRLERPVADAQRMFLADRLLNEGFRAETIIRALGVEESPDDERSKYSPDQPRVPAGSGRASGEWTPGAASQFSAPAPAVRQRPAHPGSHAASGRHQAVQAPRPQESTPETRPPAIGSGSSGSGQRETGEGHAVPRFSIDLPMAIIGGSLPPVASRIGQAAKAVGDAVEIAESVAAWRELGPKGEIAIREAVEARGWIVLGKQVYVRTALGLRVEDLMVHVPAGTAGNATAYDGFLEVKVNGGRYSPLQQAKDAIIGTAGGVLLTPITGYDVGSKVVLETGLSNVTIIYEPK